MNNNRVRIDLKALREAASNKLGEEVSSAYAADLVLVSRRSWLRWENNDKTIPAGVVKRFCAVTGLEPNDWIIE